MGQASILLCLMAFLGACGADKLKSNVANKTFVEGLNKECSYTSSGPPVCGNDGKNYLNKAHAECFTTVKNVGHCTCSNSLIVCGSDEQNHTECEASGNVNYSIVRFAPCGASEL